MNTMKRWERSLLISAANQHLNALEQGAERGERRGTWSPALVKATREEVRQIREIATKLAGMEEVRFVS